ncbi:MAG: serine/threonine-protein kinase [Kiritimatiellia bacterium]|jgi:serine/threonine-protein kinase|nr:serine/threonine-protein kinase [Kiritimatiellia bacterium]
MDETPKERIGEYELLELIGDGAQGRVYKARHVAGPEGDPQELVALKVVRITGEDEKLRLKFQEQAEILRRLSHTHIVAYRDCFAWHAGEWDEAQCLVMELLEGETLTERLKNASSGLPWPQVEQIFEQCLAGLIHARERGITHRDIKPSNIFLTQDGQTKIIDFDIARRDDSGQMSTAGWKGTFDYMAPDFISIDGFRGDETSDVFSLGVCFYQALTGSLPYEKLGEAAHIGYLNRWRDQAAPAPSFRPGVFRVLAQAKTVVAKAIAARREQRYATFAAFLEEFRKIRYRRIRNKSKEEYELLAVLGRGGFGEVFKARRVSDGLLVAVKFLFSEKQSDRFLKEAKILQQYPHPNLVQYVDFITIEGLTGEKQFFLVMEFLEGMPGWTLRPRLKHEGKLEVGEAVALFSGYLSALQFLHGSARPIIHRDIKPGNLYAPVGQPEKGKIFDLGVARDVSGTVTVGGVPGTLDYMAPEFAEAGGDRGSPQSDLYALGLCLYESLAGKPVFERLPGDLNSAWVAFQDRLRKPPEISFDAEAFTRYPRFKGVIFRALAPNPADRFRSAEAMRKALQEALLPESALPEDDGFDAGEGLTMATFAGARPAEPEPGATTGTRAVSPEAFQEALDEQARQADRRRPRERAGRSGPGRLVAVIAGTAVTVILLVGLAVYWLGREEPEAEQTARMEKPVSPAAPLPAAPTVTPPAPEPVPQTAPIPVQAKPEVVAVKPAAPEKPAAPAPVTEKAAAQPAAATETGKPPGPVRQAEARPAPVEKPVAVQAAPPVRPAPAAPAVTPPAPAPVVQKPDPAALRAKEVAEAAARVKGAAARLRQEGFAACAGVLDALAAVSAPLRAEKAVKPEWDAARDVCAGILEQEILRKDPLAQRAQRLKTAGEMVAGRSAAAVLEPSRAAELGKSLRQQQGVCVLRLVNQGAQTVRVSAREWPEPTALAGGEVKDWLIPVPGETLTMSITVDEGSRFRSRMETVRLPRGGGVERAIVGAVAQTAAPVPKPEPAPAAKPAPAAGQAAVPAATAKPAAAPPAAAAAKPPEAVPAAPKTFFQLSVSPKIGILMVDGKVVDAGLVEVEPGVNHKVEAVCQGYKPVEQYYKAKSGETRKIDILLEKEVKRSLFGF